MTLLDAGPVLACLCAAAAGFLGCSVLLDALSVTRWKKVLKAEASGVFGEAGPARAGGLAGRLVDLAVRESAGGPPSLPSGKAALLVGGLPSLEGKAVLAGLRGRVSSGGICRAGALACLAATAFGCVFGSLLSLQLGLLLGLSGFLAGRHGLSWAFGREAEARKRLAEGCLSEALEVICLGLRSGLSFDYALRLYCRYFPGVFARDMAGALGEWSSGLKTREQALRDVAASYDSAVLARVVESVVRSMRFGSPLAAELESLAEEVRRTHKAEVQEKVMKAPVKMMLPVGTLILPSMLILVLGPVLLDLSSGF